MDAKVQTGVETAKVAGESTTTNRVAQPIETTPTTPGGVVDAKVQTGVETAKVAGESTTTNRVAQPIEATPTTPGGVVDAKVQTGVETAKVAGESTTTNRVAQPIETTPTTPGGVVDAKVQTGVDIARVTSETVVSEDVQRTLSNRPNAGVDISSLHVNAITENDCNPYERAKDGKFPDSPVPINPTYNPTRMQMFGHIVSVPYRAVVGGLDAVNNAVGAVVSGMERAGSSLIGVTSTRAIGSILGSIGDAMDVLGVVQTFGDAMFYTKYMKDDVKFLNGQMLRDNLVFSIQQQINAINTYNSKIDTKNSSTPPPTEKYAKIQYPIISGPLELVDKDHNSPFYSQVRVETEIDSVREKLLRTDTIHRQNFITIKGQAFYDSVFNNPSKTLVSYVDANFGGVDNDALYRDAFTNVCNYYKGVVYEDKYPMDDTTGRAGRSRFQCGWGTAADCETYAKQWFDSIYTTKKDPPGNYAEWFNFSEFDSILASDGTRVVPQMTFTQKGACIITNSGIRSMCRMYKGTYANHTCEYTPEYCQSIGTCFDTSTKSCYLPPDTMEALSIGFGTGGVREFIKVYGCKFTSGMASDPSRTAIDNVVLSSAFLTLGGIQIVKDVIANQPQWNEGFRQVLKKPTNSLNFTASALGVGAFMGPASFARFAGPLAILAGLAAAIVGVTDMIRDTAEQRMRPTIDKQEYTTGGWNSSQSDTKGYMPKGVSFVDGWVTRPLKYHPVGQPGSPYTSVTQIPGNRTIYMFDTRFIAGQIATGCNSNLTWELAGATYLGGRNIAQQTCWQNGPTGQYTMIRAGTHKCDNEVVCIPAFPGTSLAVSGIGPIATGVTKWLTNNVWTSGDYPGVPLYPSQPYSDPDNYTNTFYYQLVYDKDGINQTNMWTNLTLMRQYFSEATINQMRWYYCNKFIRACPSGRCVDGTTINPKCYGYLTLDTTKYKSLRMTLPGV